MAPRLLFRRTERLPEFCGCSTTDSPFKIRLLRRRRRQFYARYDATNIAHLLYSSVQNPADTPGFGIKFTEPIVANGKVFVETHNDSLSTASNRKANSTSMD